MLLTLQERLKTTSLVSGPVSIVFVPGESWSCKTWNLFSKGVIWTVLCICSYSSAFSSFLPSRYLNKAFHIWSKKDKFSSTFVNNTISHTDTERAAPAWMLLSKIAGSAPTLNYTKVLQSWETLSRFACSWHSLLTTDRKQSSCLREEGCFIAMHRDSFFKI